MTAPTISQVLAGLETRLLTIDGLRVDAYMADQINPPAALVGVPPIESYRQTMQRGILMMQPTIYVFVSAALDRIGQQLLAEFADVTGSRSIPLAIEGDRTLGGVVQDVVVQAFRPLGMDEVGQIGYYGGVFDLLVDIRGK